jgi:hypothetical protein
VRLQSLLSQNPQPPSQGIPADRLLLLPPAPRENSIQTPNRLNSVLRASDPLIPTKSSGHKRGRMLSYCQLRPDGIHELNLAAVPAFVAEEFLLGGVGWDVDGRCCCPGCRSAVRVHPSAGAPQGGSRPYPALAEPSALPRLCHGPATGTSGAANAAGSHSSGLGSDPGGARSSGPRWTTPPRRGLFLSTSARPQSRWGSLRSHAGRAACRHPYSPHGLPPHHLPALPGHQRPPGSLRAGGGSLWPGGDPGRECGVGHF